MKFQKIEDSRKRLKFPRWSRWRGGEGVAQVADEISAQVPKSYEGPAINVQEGGEAQTFTHHATINNLPSLSFFKLATSSLLLLLLLLLHLSFSFSLFPRDLSLSHTWSKIPFVSWIMRTTSFFQIYYPLNSLCNQVLAIERDILKKSTVSWS